MMEIPLSDITDRYSILLLKWLHGADVRDELRAYGKECPNTDALFDLLRINYEIWKLESDLRQGKEGTLGLEEVGKRALAIRDYNHERVEIKNRITRGFQEIKTDHASD